MTCTVSFTRHMPPSHASDQLHVCVGMQLVEVMYRAAARLNVQLGWLPDRLAEGNFDLEEPPERASPWGGVLLSHLATFRQKLSTAAILTPEDISMVGHCSCLILLPGVLWGGSSAASLPA